MSTIDGKMLEKLQQMIYPESLEQFSKVTTIITDDLSFKVDEIFQLKECQKLTSSREVFNALLDSIASAKVITLNEAKTEGKIILSSNLILYSFVNIPYDYNRDKVLSFLKLSTGDYIRLYKQSMFWVLAIENSEFNQSFEKLLKILKVEDDCPLKYNITSSQMLKNAISKMIQNYAYSKETNDLTVKSPQKQQTTSPIESMSWRKKSDVSDQSYGSKNNYYKNKRQRFKSDPNEYQHGFYGRKEEIEEVQIELDNIKYPLDIKYKYSNKEMIDFYEKIKDTLNNRSITKNAMKIDEIHYVDEKMKKLAIAEKENYTNAMPKNNPLLNFNIKK